MTRIYSVALIVGIVGLLAVSRLIFLQIIHAEEYKDLATRQYAAPKNERFNRGNIFFEEKDGTIVPAATLDNGFTIFIKPDEIKEVEKTLEKISQILPNLKPENFLQAAKKKNDPYEEIAVRVEKTKGEEIIRLHLPGVYAQKSSWRLYPEKNLSAQTLGFVAYDQDILRGRYGLERYYDDVLVRKNHDPYQNFFTQLFANVGSALAKDETFKNSADLITTLEPNVIRELEKTLSETHKNLQTELVGGIIMDPQTGAVLAMEAVPNFDLNSFQSVANAQFYQNPLVENVYELGSIIKPLTLAAGLDAGVINEKTTYQDLGSININGKIIRNSDKKGHGVVPMQEVLSKSLNTGAVFVEQSLGKEKFREYFRQHFELDQETGIDLPGEVRGLSKNLDSEIEVDVATASFGQGIALTPIATVRALAALGNGGFLVNPHLVKANRYPGGTIREVTPNEPKRILKKETSETITKMLVEVVDKALVGGTFRNNHYSLAAKTGTAQMVGEDGKYDENKYLHSFFGYFPASSPKFIVFLYAVNPKNVGFASQSLTKPFMQLTQFLISYYNILPDRNLSILPGGQKIP